ncbi:uncharacterized protein At3g52155, chloroplastic [Selaginella moellendorffii]|nr:uncharacterized protein At3g52155, chloroplastic [Selaginella moellendorffii]|eukprot:XP_002974533.2 uncharacterized protein At3g52155, chloroplastic [Selaginella moellendorffii]
MWAGSNCDVALCQGANFLSSKTPRSSGSGSGGSGAVSKSVRRLILLRHAHSSWANRSLKDHERPLSGRGRQQAASIAAKLRELGWLPELVLCSDSTRTRETLEIIKRHTVELLQVETHFLTTYYSVAAMDGHTAQHIRETICKFAKDDIATVLCMGHNRGWEEAASILCGRPLELKTSNAALLEAHGCSWQETFASAGAGGWKLREILQPAAVAESSKLDIDLLT